MSSKTDSADRGKGDPPTKPRAKEGYRQRYFDPTKGKRRPATIRPARAIFSGLNEDHKCHIYDVGTGSQADQFNATTKALVSYGGQKCSNPQYIQITIDCHKYVVIPIPT